MKIHFSLNIFLLFWMVFAIIVLIFLVSLNNLEALKRDYKRKADIAQIKLALEMYYDDNQGKYPKSESKPDSKGWLILKNSLENKYLDQVPLDPLNNKRYNYKFGSIDGKSYQIIFEMEKE